jgi:excinuclease ABC subunit C
MNPKAFALTLTTAPGVYQMMDKHHHIIYIGKARNLKKRVSSYFQKKAMSARIDALVKQIETIEVIVTQNENEALLLENQLIKKHRPKYNILLRDDKSYPFILLSRHAFPRLFWRRGEKSKENEKFGPYPSVVATRETVKFIQNLFKLRICPDNFFKNRARPCLLYQLKKCTAPCVGHVSAENYAEDVKNAKLLLQGKNQEVIDHLVSRMTAAASLQNYELAARLRDQMTSLRHVQSEQAVTTQKGNIDVFVAVSNAIQILLIREGQVLGSAHHALEVPFSQTPAEMLSAFIPQYYLDNEKPSEIVIKQKLEDQAWLQNALKLKISVARQTDKLQWIKMAEKSALEAMKSTSMTLKRFQVLQNFLKLSAPISRMVCFDISHTFGESTVASCVVFDERGPIKKEYRRFNIQEVKKSDDYAAIAQAVERYFHHIKSLPEVVIIDGGKGQLHEAEKILTELNLINQVNIIAVAKGAARKPGHEQIFISGKKLPVDLDPQSGAFHLLQQIRDEAHRFAITAHRKKRAKTRKTSMLENIPGIGVQKSKALLTYLGGWQELKKASVDALSSVPGINRLLAEKIYHYLHQ